MEDLGLVKEFWVAKIAYKTGRLYVELAGSPRAIG